MRLEFDLDRLVDEVATRVAAELSERIASEASSPWMAMEEAIAYTRIPAGTFRKWVAAGRIPAHGGRRKLFHRAEVDAALGYQPARPAGAGMSPGSTSAPHNDSQWEAQPLRGVHRRLRAGGQALSDRLDPVTAQEDQSARRIAMDRVAHSHGVS